MTNSIQLNSIVSCLNNYFANLIKGLVKKLPYLTNLFGINNIKNIQTSHTYLHLYIYFIHSNPFFLINGRLLYFHLKKTGVSRKKREGWNVCYLPNIQSCMIVASNVTQCTTKVYRNISLHFKQWSSRVKI